MKKVLSVSLALPYLVLAAFAQREHQPYLLPGGKAHLAAQGGCSAPAAESSPSPDALAQENENQTPGGIDIAETPAKNEGPYVFGYSPSTMNNPYFIWMEGQIREYVESKGDQLITVDAQNDPSKQIELCEDLLMQDIDALLVGPLDSASIKSALVSAQAKNVPVIVVDSLVMDTEYVETTVASDNYKAGFVCGEDMKKILPEGSEVAIIAIPTAENCVKRVDGFKAAVGDYFKLVGNEPDGKGDTGTALPLAEDLLQGNPKLAGFFCANDPMAIACVQAVEAAKRTGEVAIYGVDGAPEAKAAIAAGKMTGTGAQSPTNIGRQSVDAAYTVLSGGTVDKDIAVETFLINADNVEKYGTDAWQ
mgnify:CR=1 FL=1